MQDHVVKWLNATRGWTPLHFACAERDASSVSQLLASGADPTRPDACGRTPFDLTELELPHPVCRTTRELLIEALQPWSPARHATFPAPFRRAVRWLLLIYVRGCRTTGRGLHCVPYEVWCAVVAWLPRSWHLPCHSALCTVVHRLSTGLSHVLHASTRSLLRAVTAPCPTARIPSDA